MIAHSRHAVCRALRPMVLILLIANGASPFALSGQTRMFTACTPDALAVCAEVRLTSGPSLFVIGIRNLGAGNTMLPTSVYNLIFSTGAPASAVPGDISPVPVASGGATVSDASPWDLFDAGDAVFLSAVTNRGVGGCAVGADVDGFGQAARTCGTGQFVSFSFTPTHFFNPALFTLLDFEAVALTNPSQGASCGAPELACRVTEAATVAPEPLTFVMLGAALAVLVGAMALRRGRV